MGIFRHYGRCKHQTLTPFWAPDLSLRVRVLSLIPPLLFTRCVTLGMVPTLCSFLIANMRVINHYLGILWKEITECTSAITIHPSSIHPSAKHWAGELDSTCP